MTRRRVSSLSTVQTSAPVVDDAGRAGHDVEEHRVGVLAAQPRVAPRRRLHLQHLHPALVAALDHDDQAGLASNGR